MTALKINDQSLNAQARETLLDTALRNGIDFPYSCRVGGCGTCKCKLASGRVKELTETAYLLSQEEIEDGTILACQSVPLSNDVAIEVDLSPRGIPGTVVAQTRATHDITHLTLQLSAPLDYRAGQFAHLTFPALEGVTRSYSMASAPSPEGLVSFYIRHVPGGRMSSFVHTTDLVGHTVYVDGPAGDFFLRDHDNAPILLVAGGSGLAPILALLQDAAERRLTRPVTLLFGARQERDLYAQDAIEALARAWPAPFDFVPVLSECTDPTWTGARGLVTEHLAAHAEPGAHAYLCGPPPMVDAGVEALVASNVAPEHIHFDRFTTRADAAAAETPREEEEVAGVLHYLKYFSFHLVGLLSAGFILAGGAYITAGLLAVLATYIIGDALGGDDTSTPTFRRPGILTAQLWMALPLLAGIAFVSVWSVASGDPLGFGAWLSGLLGYDVLAAKAATTLGQHAAAVVLTGLMIGMVGTIPAHELTHRTWDPISMMTGRWLLAFSFDTVFSIEHVYGHHRYVSTEEDPATAPRGRNVYAHVVISTLRGNQSAWHIEAERLEKRSMGLFSWHNAVIRGHLMSVALVVAAGLIGGWTAAGYFVLCALMGKALLEIVNYMEHYGMVRNPETPVQPRHSWNTNRRMSSWTLFNLTRHSHHHAQGEVPYQELKPYPEAPMMISGYLTTILVALIPPLWHRLMTPKVLEWDAHYASDEERILARDANKRAGLHTSISPRATTRRPNPSQS